MGRILGHEHHKCSAGAVCKQRGTYHDAHGSLYAHRRCNRALLSRPVVHLRNSEPVLERAISAEWAAFSAMSTINAVQEQYASNEGLTMMHMDHSMPIGGAIAHLCLDKWCSSGAQTWFSSGRFQLNGASFLGGNSYFRFSL